MTSRPRKRCSPTQTFPVADVAKRIGVSVAMLYRNFPAARDTRGGGDVARYVPGCAAPTLHNSSKKRCFYAISIESTLFADGAWFASAHALAALQSRKRGTSERSSTASLFRHRPFYAWLDSASVWVRRWCLARQLYTRCQRKAEMALLVQS